MCVHVRDHFSFATLYRFGFNYKVWLWTYTLWFFVHLCYGFRFNAKTWMALKILSLCVVTGASRPLGQCFWLPISFFWDTNSNLKQNVQMYLPACKTCHVGERFYVASILTTTTTTIYFLIFFECKTSWIKLSCQIFYLQKYLALNFFGTLHVTVSSPINFIINEIKK